MKLLPQTGLLYDAVTYCTVHFSAEKTDVTIGSAFSELAEEVESLPKITAPFFTARDTLPAPVLAYLKQQPCLTCGRSCCTPCFIRISLPIRTLSTQTVLSKQRYGWTKPTTLLISNIRHSCV